MSDSVWDPTSPYTITITSTWTPHMSISTTWFYIFPLSGWNEDRVWELTRPAQCEWLAWLLWFISTRHFPVFNSSLFNFQSDLCLLNSSTGQRSFRNLPSLEILKYLFLISSPVSKTSSSHSMSLYRSLSLLTRNGLEHFASWIQQPSLVLCHLMSITSSRYLCSKSLYCRHISFGEEIEE